MASSEAVVPLENMEQLGVPKHIVGYACSGQLEVHAAA
jgi:hypothetical protein